MLITFQCEWLGLHQVYSFGCQQVNGRCLFEGWMQGCKWNSWRCSYYPCPSSCCLQFMLLILECLVLWFLPGSSAWTASVLFRVCNIHEVPKAAVTSGFVTSKLDFNFLNSGNFPSLCWAHSTFLWDNSFRIVDREERKVSVTFSKTFMALGVEVHTCQSQHLGVQVRRILSSSQLGLHNKALPQ